MRSSRVLILVLCWPCYWSCWHYWPQCGGWPASCGCYVTRYQPLRPLPFVRRWR